MGWGAGVVIHVYPSRARGAETGQWNSETVEGGWRGVRSGGGARLVIHVWRRARKSGQTMSTGGECYMDEKLLQRKGRRGRAGERGGEKINGRDIVHIVRWWVGG